MKLPSAGHATGGKRRAAGRQRAAGSGQRAAGSGQKRQNPDRKKTEKGCPEGQPFSLWLSQIGMFRDYTMPCAIIACATFSKPAMFAPATRL